MLAGYRAAQVRQIAEGSRSYIWRRQVRAALVYLAKLILRRYDATLG